MEELRGHTVHPISCAYMRACVCVRVWWWGGGLEGITCIPLVVAGLPQPYSLHPEPLVVADLPQPYPLLPIHPEPLVVPGLPWACPNPTPYSLQSYTLSL